MDLLRASSGRPCLLGVARIGYEPNPAWLAPVAQRSLDEQLDEASAPEIGHQVRGSTSSALIVPEFPARPDYKPRPRHPHASLHHCVRVLRTSLRIRVAARAA